MIWLIFATTPKPSLARRKPDGRALAICETIEGLQYMPHRGRVGRKPGTREVMVTGLPFVIIYQAKNEAIEILRILHGAQQWP